jgi:hypothetical protein
MFMPDALPPDEAVPVESPLIRRLYATREWSETEALLTDDFVWHDERGKRRRAKHLKYATQWAEGQLEDPHATIEAIVADLSEPTVLYVRDRTRGRTVYRYRPDIDVIAWTRVIVAPCGTRIRELGPTTIIGRLTRND